MQRSLTSSRADYSEPARPEEQKGTWSLFRPWQVIRFLTVGLENYILL